MVKKFYSISFTERVNKRNCFNTKIPQNPLYFPSNEMLNKDVRQKASDSRLIIIEEVNKRKCNGQKVFLQAATTTTSLPASRVWRNGSHIFNATDLHARTSQSSQGGLSAQLSQKPSTTLTTRMPQLQLLPLIVPGQMNGGRNTSKRNATNFIKSFKTWWGIKSLSTQHQMSQTFTFTQEVKGSLKPLPSSTMF